MAITESELVELIGTGAATEFIVVYDQAACARMYVVINNQRVAIGSARHPYRLFKTSSSLCGFLRKVGIKHFESELEDG